MLSSSSSSSSRGGAESHGLWNLTKSICEERSTLCGLPADVEINILARLLMPDLFRLRLVCKKWQSLLSSPSFLSSLPPNPCLFMWPIDQYPYKIFDRLGNISLMDVMSGRHYSYPHVNPSFCTLRRMYEWQFASAGGLVVLSRNSYFNLGMPFYNYMLLLNPFSKCYLKISIPFHIPFYSVALLADPARKTYTMYCMHKKGTLSSYNSQSCSWKTFPPSPRSVLPQSSVVSSTCLFVLSEAKSWNKMSILVYEMEQAIWRTVEVHPSTIQSVQPMLRLESHQLLLYKEELLLGAILYRKLEVPREVTLGIWKLQYTKGHTTGEWNQIFSMDCLIVDQCKFTLLGDLICCIVSSSLDNYVLVYDLVGNKYWSFSYGQKHCMGVIQPLLAFDP